MFVVSPWYDIFCRLRSSFRTPRLNYPVFLNFPEFGNDRKCILWISRFLPRHHRRRHSSTSSLYNIYQWLMTLHSLFLPRYPALSCQMLRKCKLHLKTFFELLKWKKNISQSASAVLTITTLAHTMPGHRFWSSQSISQPLLNNSMYVWRMENASVLHFIHLAVCMRAGHSSSNTTFYLQNSSNFSENLLPGRSRRPRQHQLFCLSLNISLAPLCLST